MRTLQKIVNISAVMGVMGTIALGKYSVHQHQRIQELKQEVSSTKFEKDLLELQRIKLHHKLIQMGNPYEWKLNGDGIGSSWYERYESDGWAGGYEYLPAN